MHVARCVQLCSALRGRCGHQEDSTYVGCGFLPTLAWIEAGEKKLMLVWVGCLAVGGEERLDVCDKRMGSVPGTAQMGEKRSGKLPHPALRGTRG